MDELFLRVWENLVDRVSGPMSLRLLVQPFMAALFAFRSGWRDGRDGKSPFFWGLLYDPANRHDMLSQGWKDVGKVFLIAVALDVVYQLIVLRWVYPIEALIVAILLAIVPYLLVRGPVTLVVRLARGERDSTS